MNRKNSTGDRSDLTESGIFVFLTLVIFFGAVGFPTLINTTPTFGYDQNTIQRMTPVTSFYQEAFAQENAMAILGSYYFDPMMLSAHLVMPTAIDMPPPDLLKYFEYKLSKTELEFGFIPFDDIEKFLNPETYFPKAYADHISTTGLEAYWNFQQTSGNLLNSDISNIFPNGNSTSDSGITKTDTGIIGNGWTSSPTASDTNVLIGGLATDWNFLIQGNSTFNFWIKDRDCSANNEFIFDTPNTSDVDGLRLLVHCNLANTMETQWFGNGLSIIETTANGYYEKGTGSYNMYTIVHDNTNNEIRWYKNATLFETDPTSSNNISDVNDNPPRLFNNRITPSQPLGNATMDEFSVWSRVLTTTEISQLYNSGSAHSLAGLEQEISDVAVVVDQVNTQLIPSNPPATITDLQVFPIENSIFMNWTEPAGSPNFYLIERADGNKSRLGSDDFLIYHQDRQSVSPQVFGSSTEFAFGQELVLTNPKNITRIDSSMIRASGTCAGSGVLRGGIWSTSGSVLHGSSNATISGCSLATSFTSELTATKPFFFDPPVQLSAGTYVFGVNMTGTIDKTVSVAKSSANVVDGTPKTAPSDTFPYVFSSVAGDFGMNIRVENFELIANVTAPQTNFTDSGLEDGITYFYRARGSNNAGTAVNGSNIAFTKEPVRDDGLSSIINNTSPRWFYREVDSVNCYDQGAGCTPAIAFTTLNGQIRMNPASGVGSNSIGQGFIMKSFNKTEVFGSDFKVNWSGQRLDAFSGTVFFRLYDGAYNVQNNPDFPLTSAINTIGGGILASTSITLGADFSNTVTTLTNGSIAWGSSTEDFVTLAMIQEDPAGFGRFDLQINNVTVTNLGTWQFHNKPTTVTHLENQFESHVQDYWDSGYYDQGTFTPFQVPDAPANISATADIDTVIVDWDAVVATPSVDRYWIQRNGTTIANTDGLSNVWSDNFSGYTSSAHGALTWVSTLVASESIIEVDTTNGAFHEIPVSLDGSFETPDSVSIHTEQGAGLRFIGDRLSADKVTVDLLPIIGQTITDSSGLGDFSLRWTQESTWCKDNNPLGAPQAGSNCYNPNKPNVGLSDIDERWFTSGGSSRNAVVVEWLPNLDATFDSEVLLFTHNNGGRVFKASDTSCGDGSNTRSTPSHYDSATPASSKFGKQKLAYFELNKTGTTYTVRVGDNPAYSGFSCSISTVIADVYENLRYLTISIPSGGAVPNAQTNEWRFDNFQLFLEGQTPVTKFIDDTVARGTNYQYGVFAENNEGNGTAGLSNVVLTNNVPAQVQNLQFDNSTTALINLQWNKLPVTSGQGSPSTGVNLTSHKIFRNNVTTGGGFFLLKNNPINATGFDPTTMSFVQSSLITAQDLNPFGVFIRPDGLRMWLVGGDGKDVNEYRMTKPFDVSTRTFITSKSVSAQTIAPRDVHFKPDGTRMYVSSSGTTLFEYTLSTAWDVSTASFFQSKSLTGLTLGIEGMFFRDDGKKLYVADGSAGATTAYEYDLSTAWDISTATFLQSNGLGTHNARDLYFKPDGTKMFVLDSGTFDFIKLFSISPAWDLSSATFVSSKSIDAQDPTHRNFYMKSDGLKLITSGSTNDRLYEYNLAISDFVNFYNDTKVIGNDVYDYKVSACNQLDCGTNSTTVTVTASVVNATENLSDFVAVADQTFLKSPPFPITTLSVNTVSNECRLSWSAPADGNSPITGYKILRKVATDPFTVLVANTGNTLTTYNNTGLVAGLQHQYDVRGLNAFGDGETSNIVSCTPPVTGVPSAPTVTTLVEQGNGDVTVSWTKPSTGDPTGYKIERRVGNGAFVTIVANTGNTNLSYLDTTTDPATEYGYRISGINSFGTGTVSNIGTITTVSPPSAPILSGQQNVNQIDLSWVAPASASPINGYKIERQVNGGAFSVLVANTTTTTTAYTDLNVMKPNTYGYRVKALSSAGEGAVSNVVSIVFGSHVVVQVREQDGSGFKGGGTVIASNSTFSQSKSLNANSNAVFDNFAVGNFNYTFRDNSNFILNKTFNFPFPSGNLTSTFTIEALVFDVDCPANGVGADVRIKVNYTNDKDIFSFPSTPVCDSTDQVSWSTRWIGENVTDTSIMVADFISTVFKTNAKTFLASANLIPTTYSSGTNAITSDPFQVNATDVTINFNLFLGRAPAGGGGGGGGSGKGDTTPPSQSIPNPNVILQQRLTGLSLLSRTHQFAQAGDILEGSVSVAWEGEQNLVVKGIDIGDVPFDLRFDLPPFPLQQNIDGVGEFAKSSAEIPYTIVLPDNQCNEELGITQNCFDPILHTLPIIFRFGLGDQEYEASTEIFVDGRPIPLDIVQLQIILLFLVLVASAVFGNFIRTRLRKKTVRTSKVKKKFKKKFDSS